MEIIPYDPVYAEGLRPLLEDFERNTAKEKFIEPEVAMALSDLERGVDRALLAVDQAQVIGFLVGHYYRNQADEFRIPQTLEIAMVYVDQHYRKRGIGRKLTSQLIDDVSLREQLKVLKIISCIEDCNKPSIALHKSMGFRSSGSYSDGGRNYLVLRKSL